MEDKKEKKAPFSRLKTLLKSLMDRRQREYTKRVVSRIINHAIVWVYLSYVLAFLDKIQITEALAQTVVTAILGVAVTSGVKSLIENVFKYNEIFRSKRPEEEDYSDGSISTLGEKDA